MHIPCDTDLILCQSVSLVDSNAVVSVEWFHKRESLEGLEIREELSLRQLQLQYYTPYAPYRSRGTCTDYDLITMP